MKYVFSIIIFILCSTQISCVGDSNNLNNNATNNVNDAGGIQNVVRLSSSTTIPFIESKNKLVSFLVATNNGENKLSLTGVYTQDNQGNLVQVSNKTLIDASACATLQAQSTCRVAFYPHVEKSYLLELRFSDDGGQTYASKQLINVKKPIMSDNGFMYFKDNLNLIFPGHGKNTLSFPIILDDNYKEVVASISDHSLKTDVVCGSEPGVAQYTKGMMCTVLISGAQDNIIKDRKVDKLTVKGIKLSTQNENDVNQFTQNLMITTSIVGNFITSAFNTVISPADGTVGNRQLITLFNNGVAAISASTINIYAPSPITTITGTIPCTGSIAAGSSCNFFVNVTAGLIISGQGSVTVSYNNSSTINLINLTVVYIVTPAAPGLRITSNGNFLNTFVGSGVTTYTLLITNTGNVTFNNLTFNSVNAQNSSINYGVAGTTCVTGQSLTPNSSCVMVIGYNPQVAQTVGNINIYPVFSYTLNGTTQSYASAGIAIAYSAVSASQLVVVGDFGSVASSTAVATWVASTSPPFVTNAISGQSLIQGAASLYVLGVASTATGTLYTSSGGIIWTVDPVSPGPTAVLGLLYDGTKYIVAGGFSARTILINTTVPGGTWDRRSTVTVGTLNSLLFAGGGYIATLSSVPNLETSADGITWGSSSISGSYLTSLWDGSTYYAFGVNGVCASATVATAASWTARPVISTLFTARSSVYNNGLYVAVGAIVSTGVNVVYTTTNPQSVAWTARATPATTQLNRIVFAQNQYVAVGNAGVIITSPNATTWTTRTSGTAASLTTVYYDGSFFWAVGAAIILVSPDGVNWTRATLNSIAYNGTNYISVGTAGRIYTSTNLTSWTLQTSGTTNILEYVQCVSSSLCMAVGDNGTILTTSNGGTTWVTSTSGTTANLMGLTCGLSNCIAVGVSGASGTVVSASLSSSIWNVSATTASGLNSVSYLTNPSGTGSGGDLFVAVGAAGLITTSPDGVTWTTRASGVAVALNSVTCSLGATTGCIAVGVTDGTRGVILTSPDGITWTQSTAGITNVNLNSVAYYGGDYIVAGDTNTLLTSSDGISWMTRNSNISATTAINLRGALAY